jgi:hypothetical protein
VLRVLTGLVLRGALVLLSLPVAAEVPAREPRAADHAAQVGVSAVPVSRSPVPVPRPWSDLLREHLVRYPLAEPVDVYKFTHQSVFGPAHAVPSREQARRYLDEELAALPPGPPDEPLADRLSDDPSLVRLNLRPFLAAGGDPGTLVDAFAATAGEVKGSAEAMRSRLGSAVEVLRSSGRTAAADDLAALARAHEREGFPAVHHGAAYRAAYAPAYRVVSASRLPPLRSR